MSTSDAIYSDLGRRLPSWAMRGLDRVVVPGGAALCGEVLCGEVVGLDPAPGSSEAVAKDLVYGALAGAFGRFRDWLDESVMPGTRLAEATGPWLDLHARERGAGRVEGEVDEALRARIRAVPDRVTERAIAAGAEQIAGMGNVDVFTLRMREAAWDRDFWDTDRRWSGWVLPADWLRLVGGLQGFWDVDFWDVMSWGGFADRNSLTVPGSSWLVAVIHVLEALAVSVQTFWDVSLVWNASYWGDTTPDAAAYRRLRRWAEEARAAGVSVEIWVGAGWQ